MATPPFTPEQLVWLQSRLPHTVILGESAHPPAPLPLLVGEPSRGSVSAHTAEAGGSSADIATVVSEPRTPATTGTYLMPNLCSFYIDKVCTLFRGRNSCKI